MINMLPFFGALTLIAILAATFASPQAQASEGTQASHAAPETPEGGAAQEGASSDPFYKYDLDYHTASARHRVPWRWLKAIAIVESNQGQAESVAYGIAHPDDITASVSRDGFSYGIMQLTLPTANRPRVRPGTTAHDLNTPSVSIDIAAAYLAELDAHYFPGDRESIIRAYNGGPGFKHTASGLRDTPKYYAKFLTALSRVQNAQPGIEMEIG